jgi:predicted Zn-dependent protease
MESVTRPEPRAAEPKTSDVNTVPERELSREELVAELERVVSQAKTDSKRWDQRAGAVSDDLLPRRRS